MARTCVTCSHPKRADIDEMLAFGVAPAAVAEKYDLHRNSLYRHRANHLAQPVTEGEELDFIEVGSRLVSLANETRRDRLAAQASGQRHTALRAAAIELRVLDTLASRLGIDDSRVLDEIEQAQRLYRVVGRFARTAPVEAEGLIRELRAADLDDLADQIEQHRKAVTAA